MRFSILLGSRADRHVDSPRTGVATAAHGGEKLKSNNDVGDGHQAAGYRAELHLAENIVNPDTWAGGMEDKRAIAPRLRIGRDKWFNLLWLIPIGFGLLVAAVAVGKGLHNMPAIHEFILRYPWSPSMPTAPPCEPGLGRIAVDAGWRRTRCRTPLPKRKQEGSQHPQRSPRGRDDRVTRRPRTSHFPVALHQRARPDHRRGRTRTPEGARPDPLPRSGFRTRGRTAGIPDPHPRREGRWRRPLGILTPGRSRPSPRSRGRAGRLPANSSKRRSKTAP
jgi:hypothetical protein